MTLVETRGLHGSNYEIIIKEEYLDTPLLANSDTLVVYADIPE